VQINVKEDSLESHERVLVIAGEILYISCVLDTYHIICLGEREALCAGSIFVIFP
jgi:hypothetical protein